MGRLYKCVVCGEPIQEQEASIPFKNRKAHKRCFDVTMKTLGEKTKQTAKAKKSTAGQKAPPNAEISAPVSEEEFQEKTAFYALLSQLLMTEKLPPKVYKVSADYRKTYGFTYEGMTMALTYFYTLMENPVVGDAIGILPYVYQEAQDFFASIERANQSNGLIEDVKALYREKNLRITPRKPTPNLIDIGSIGSGCRRE